MLGHLSFAMRRPFEILHGCFDNLEVYIISVFASTVYLANKMHRSRQNPILDTYSTDFTSMTVYM